MIHHSDIDYDIALGDTAKRFQAKLEETIHASQRSALGVIEKVQKEVPRDRIVGSRGLEFSVQREHEVALATNNRHEKLHRHALAQVAERAGIPDTYVGRLLERPYGPHLLVENLTTIFRKEESKKLLVRTVGDEVRGVLSNSFKRMDSGPIIEAFAKSCADVGAVPVEGIGGDLRWAVKAILPRVFLPPTTKGSEELVAFGVQLSNSDFGRGALSLRMFMLRVICTNFATLDESLRQVHLGRRIDESIEFSRRTVELDTRTQVSAVRDIVRGVLGASKVNETVAMIGRALEERIDPKQAWNELPRLGLLKGEVDRVKDTFNNGGVEELPAGTTVARLANAISWFAKSTDPERRMELEQIAGSMLIGTKARQREAA